MTDPFLPIAPYLSIFAMAFAIIAFSYTVKKGNKKVKPEKQIDFGAL